MPDSSNTEAEGRRVGHRLRVEFDGGLPMVSLICPEDQECERAAFCINCGQYYADGKCACGVQPEGCVLYDWVNEIGAELLQGALTVPIEVEWLGAEDGPILHLEPAPTPTPEEPHDRS